MEMGGVWKEAVGEAKAVNNGPPWLDRPRSQTPLVFCPAALPSHASLGEATSGTRCRASLLGSAMFRSSDASMSIFHY